MRLLLRITARGAINSVSRGTEEGLGIGQRVSALPSFCENLKFQSII